jgi:hypothetical protein
MTRWTYDLLVRKEVGRKSTTKCIAHQYEAKRGEGKTFQTITRIWEN